MSVLDLHRLVVGTCKMAGRHTVKNILLGLHRVVVSPDYGPGIQSGGFADCGVRPASGTGRLPDSLVAPMTNRVILRVILCQSV